jgi:hypothetical protein
VLAAEIVMRKAPETIHKIRDVFGITRDLPLNYVTRTQVDGKFIDSLTREKHLIVHGGSKQGKTSLRKYNLKPDDYIVVSCQNKWEVSELMAAVLKAAGYQVKQSDTRTASGKHKIMVKAEGTGKVPMIGEISGSGDYSKETGKESIVQLKPLDLDPSDTNDIISALRSLNFGKYILLEDFHYLPMDTQRDFSFALKAFHEQSKLTFIIVGVWKEENRLTRFNGDLTNRVIPIDADTWEPSELIQVIEIGEALLNVQFDDKFKTDIANGCFNSVYIVQEACFRACEEAKVFETAQEFRVIAPDASAEELIRKVVHEQSGRYRAFINTFAAGFSPTKLEMYKWIIYAVLKSDIGILGTGLRLNHIVRTIKAKHPDGAELQTANVTNALTNVSSLQAQKDVRPIVLDYDENERRLDVVDKGFLVWLSVADVDELLQDLDLPKD